MIELQNVTKSYRTTTGRKFVFRNLSFSIPPGKNVAIIGRNGAGKSTMMRLLAGLDAPDSGRIVTPDSISWPVGLTGGFQGSLTGRENVKFVARVYGADRQKLREIVAYVEDFAEIGEYFDQPVKTYSSGMRGRVAFGLSLAFDFDYYLVDEAMSVGDQKFKNRATEEFKRKIGKANVILVTHGMTQVKTLCDVVLVLERGELKKFDDVDEGIAYYKNL
ncbi:ABC transporter ATP-binding protein [Bordetella hinzii]|uniref:ABC transporter ATP-binding protein n=1 Tax=Bordetella hinzii TaxID=103855 RepID=UPI00045A3D98|nr:ABC transporter ATP-binding protein [Bordetella hinzii]KCB50025.1 polysialic acid transport ATP-binding protein KpsT [Bordetella hinzii 1277]QDJ37460.1 ABC transporter ATP-binding protein [Bordetella hinzii]QDJ46571.1 ABC transporter ATP-binding protein [Bordetella hinzii]QWF37436.1 ABC transporter ATP-binding protein [Bordetella hinzii]QWF41979.1 ABC transporter ATP-binding protein [Bordetella hinzii]